MEQRTLNDNASSLVDMAKVCLKQFYSTELKSQLKLKLSLVVRLSKTETEAKIFLELKL